MALLSELDTNVRNAIAEQLSSRITTLGAVERKVGETFPIWVVNSSDLTSDTEHLTDVAKNISRTTSVVYAGGAPSFAVEAQIGSSIGTQITSIPDETLPNAAVNFKATYDAIDRDFAAEDGVVRQLEAPSFRFVALWVLIGEKDWIYPVEPGTTDLDPVRRYDLAEFRDRLLGSSPVQGLIA